MARVIDQRRVEGLISVELTAIEPEEMKNRVVSKCCRAQSARM